MAKAVKWTTAARLDVKAIHDYILRDSPRYARDVALKLRHAARNLKTMSLRGSHVPGRDERLREIQIGAYRVVYFVGDDDITIIAVAHHARDLEKLLQRPK